MNFDYLKNIVDSKWTKTLVMLHWVWSNKEDLFSLSEEFKDFNIFSLNWPNIIWYNRFAWYEVDFSTGKPLYDYNNVVKWYDYIVWFIKYINEKYDIPFENIYLFWFSQWAIMSYYLLWKNSEIISWIIALSGRLLNEINISDNKKIENKKVFIGHWIQDNVIWVNNLELNKQYIDSLWIPSTTKIYNMWHSIILDEINDIKEFFKK